MSKGYRRTRRTYEGTQRKLGLVGEEAPPVMNAELEKRVKSLEGLIAFPDYCPVVNSYDLEAIYKISEMVRRNQRLTSYWLNRVASLYGIYKLQGYITE